MIWITVQNKITTGQNISFFTIRLISSWKDSLSNNLRVKYIYIYIAHQITVTEYPVLPWYLVLPSLP